MPLFHSGTSFFKEKRKASQGEPLWYRGMVCKSFLLNFKSLMSIFI
jgi:hypothetical protein